MWGPSNIPNISAARWFVSFVDDCKRVTWIFLLKFKSDENNVFQNFHNMFKTQFGTKIKRLRSNNARDYFNQILFPYFQHKIIIYESSCVINPQQNGIVERKNGHILASTRAFLFERNVPKTYWEEAALTITHLIKRIPSRVLGFKSRINILPHYFSRS